MRALLVGDIHTEAELLGTALALGTQHAVDRVLSVGARDMQELKPETSGYGLEVLDSLWELVRGRRYRYFVGGHTHVPMVRTIETLTVLNPGTLVLTQDPGVMIADFARRAVERWTLLPAPARAQTWTLPA